ncbi:uncharacterized protein ATNIH1004_000994 [Aspergillus tanneri]|uniref:MADS-box domain-containing protein n=1 Tax=Aspergillus tanneri TaxID=1220188 RepID=A0A5M9N337_9EURO|nr:uncharacterized protein ATNIH1004_000994 [Aspergillus tanneri]KAA8652090.1 hypothetical protein ATNIH1004_000994 [Aspergillus tanneri]
MPQKSSWLKKRRSESARAKTQQRHRRKRGLFKKAAEFSLECESDVVVAVRIQKTGQIYIFDSASKKKWLNTLSDLATYYPPPIQETLEDVIPQLECSSWNLGGGSASTSDDKA